VGQPDRVQALVLTGKPAVEVLEHKGAFAYPQDRPDEAEIFARAMTAKAILDVNAVIAAYDFAHWGQIADIGGGRGHLLRAILKAAPGAERLLFDLPMVIDTLDQPRLTLQAGDFFVDALPSADAYILMEVLHDWPDKQCWRNPERDSTSCARQQRNGADSRRSDARRAI